MSDESGDRSEGIDGPEDGSGGSEDAESAGELSRRDYLTYGAAAALVGVGGYGAYDLATSDGPTVSGDFETSRDEELAGQYAPDVGADGGTGGGGGTSGGSASGGGTGDDRKRGLTRAFQAAADSAERARRAIESPR